MANKTNKDMNKLIGSLLHKARDNAGVTQADLAGHVGLSTNHLSAVERGVSKASVELLLGYAEKTGKSPDEILEYRAYNVLPELLAEIAELSDADQEKLLKMLKIAKSCN